MKNSPVNSFNEWDPLEEVIVGIVDNAQLPPNHISIKPCLTSNENDPLNGKFSEPFPSNMVSEAKKNLKEFVEILKAEGITVRRPDKVNFSKSYSTPEWSCENGFHAAMPRDSLLVIGNKIIECPMAWRSRYFEVNAYRSLLKEYFLKGAKWVAAPKPQLSDKQYNYDYEKPKKGGEIKYVITEFEPTFDAADFIRCGKDIFVQKSNVTNSFGINWVRRHLDNKYNIHEVEVKCPFPMHIDTTLMPLRPGILLYNPEYVDKDKIPDIFDSWDIIEAPKPKTPPKMEFHMTSMWLNMNVLMLDKQKVVVGKYQKPMIDLLKDIGLDPIPCEFHHFYHFGGSFHCATLDIRRKGGLRSYF